MLIGLLKQTCTLDHNKGTSTRALHSTSTLDQSLVIGKPSNGVSVCVVKFPLLTLRVCNELSYIVPAAPAFRAHPKLWPPDVFQKRMISTKDRDRKRNYNRKGYIKENG